MFHPRIFWYIASFLFAALPLTGMPLFSYNEGLTTIVIKAFGNKIEGIPEGVGTTNYESTIVWVLNLLLMGLIVLSFSFYRNPQKQLLFGRIAFVTYILSMVLIILHAYAEKVSCTQCPPAEMVVRTGFLLFTLGIVTLLIGNQSVKRHQNKIYNANRRR